jgi:hypothetical protein
VGKGFHVAGKELPTEIAPKESFRTHFSRIRNQNFPDKRQVLWVARQLFISLAGEGIRGNW